VAVYICTGCTAQSSATLKRSRDRRYRHFAHLRRTGNGCRWTVDRDIPGTVAARVWARSRLRRSDRAAARPCRVLLRHGNRRVNGGSPRIPRRPRLTADDGHAWRDRDARSGAIGDVSVAMRRAGEMTAAVRDRSETPARRSADGRRAVGRGNGRPRERSAEGTVGRGSGGEGGSDGARVRDARPEGRDRGAATDLSETQGDTRRRGHGAVGHSRIVPCRARSPTRRSRGTPTPAVRRSSFPSSVRERQPGQKRKVKPATGTMGSEPRARVRPRSS
jgi:hypothetical protein